MSNKKGKQFKKTFFPPKPQINKRKVSSLLDVMIEGNEYASIIDCIPEGMNFRDEIQRGIREIEKTRNRKLICYFANIQNKNITISTSIDYSDDLPFSEMISNIDNNIKAIDVMIVTNGGSGEQVAKFVNKLRPRFDSVEFLLPDVAMSAGTIFCLSGDEIIMDTRAHIGPIDPQIPNNKGIYFPAQSLLTVINEIQERGAELLRKGAKPSWTDIEILNNIDAKEIGRAINASQFSIDMVKEYLSLYKFKTWTNHSDGHLVSDDEKINRANEIAINLCDHSIWKTHSRGITREIAWEVCKLKIKLAEEFPGLQPAIRKLWTLVYWMFESSPIAKIIISSTYSIFRGQQLIKIPRE